MFNRSQPTRTPTRPHKAPARAQQTPNAPTPRTSCRRSELQRQYRCLHEQAARPAVIEQVPPLNSVRKIRTHSVPPPPPERSPVMIEAHELTKRYGDTTAVHSLSFTI